MPTLLSTGLEPLPVLALFMNYGDGLMTPLLEPMIGLGAPLLGIFRIYL